MKIPWKLKPFSSLTSSPCEFSLLFSASTFINNSNASSGNLYTDPNLVPKTWTRKNAPTPRPWLSASTTEFQPQRIRNAETLAECPFVNLKSSLSFSNSLAKLLRKPLVGGVVCPNSYEVYKAMAKSQMTLTDIDWFWAEPFGANSHCSIFCLRATGQTGEPNFVVKLIYIGSMT